MSAHRAPRPLAALGIGVGLAFAAPFASLAARTVADPGSVARRVGSEELVGPLARTLTLAGLSSLGAAVLGVAVAWCLVRTNVPARRVLGVAAALPLVLPSFVAAFAWISAFAEGGLLQELLGVGRSWRMRGLGPAAVILTLISYPYVYLPVAARLAGLPRSVEESARALGAGPLRVFATVVLPGIRSAVAAGTLLVFLYGVSEFGAVSLLRYDTLTLRIFATRLLEPEAARAMSLVLGALALAVVAAERRVAARARRDEPAAAGGRPAVTRLGIGRVPVAAFLVAVVSVALVVPVAVLARWAARGLTGGRDLLGRGAGLGELAAPTAQTVGLAVASAITAVAVVLPVAYLTRRFRARSGEVANLFVVAGFALPGLVLALSLVTITLRVPVLFALYQTVPLLVFAYVVHFGAQALRAGEVAVESVPERLREAARSLGAGRLRRFATVEVPLMAPMLAAGAGLVLLSVAKELPATLLLSPIGVDTLAVRIWSAAGEGFFARAGLAGLVLVAVSGVLTWWVTIRRIEHLRA
jgi:iron(III) transport system permease protein